MNDALTIEYWAEDRQLVVMLAGTSPPTSAGNGELCQVANWAADTELGEVTTRTVDLRFRGTRR